MPTQADLITPSIRLVRELGAGGMGSVWLADHLSLETQVAQTCEALARAHEKGIVHPRRDVDSSVRRSRAADEVFSLLHIDAADEPAS